jgi:hypothetical protein
MGMDHYYTVFDKVFFDPVWKLSWREFLRGNRTRWATDKELLADGDTGRSLRELIRFVVDPEPDRVEIERVLASERLRETIKKSSPQLMLMDELLRHVRGGADHFISSDPVETPAALIGAAAKAFLDGRTTARTLAAVTSLHPIDPTEWIDLTKKEVARLRAISAESRPPYAWQAPYAFEDEEWAGALSVADTRRFITVVMRAWDENWPVPTVADDIPARPAGRFRDFDEARDLRKVARRAVVFRKPCAFHRWS